MQKSATFRIHIWAQSDDKRVRETETEVTHRTPQKIPKRIFLLYFARLSPAPRQWRTIVNFILNKLLRSLSSTHKRQVSIRYELFYELKNTAERAWGRWWWFNHSTAFNHNPHELLMKFEAIKVESTMSMCVFRVHNICVWYRHGPVCRACWRWTKKLTCVWARDQKQ